MMVWRLSYADTSAPSSLMRNWLGCSSGTGSPARVCTVKKTATLLGLRCAASTVDTLSPEAQPADSAPRVSDIRTGRLTTRIVLLRMGTNEGTFRRDTAGALLAPISRGSGR